MRGWNIKRISSIRFNTSGITLFRRLAPYSLNYLVFLQNAYINRKIETNETPKLPHLDSFKWGLLDEEELCENYKEVWNEVVGKL